MPCLFCKQLFCKYYQLLTAVSENTEFLELSRLFLVEAKESINAYPKITEDNTAAHNFINSPGIPIEMCLEAFEISQNKTIQKQL